MVVVKVKLQVDDILSVLGGFQPRVIRLVEINAMQK
jgi:hypothetical protein